MSSQNNIHMCGQCSVWPLSAVIRSVVCSLISRLHNTSAECYQTGYVEAGALYWHASELGPCPGGLPKGNDWFKVSNALNCHTYSIKQIYCKTRSSSRYIIFVQVMSKQNVSLF